MDFTDSSAVAATAYTVEYCVHLLASMIPVGFGLGCIPLIFGLGISGVMKIFKKIL